MSKGEGSHGGHVIGHSRSGKALYEHRYTEARKIHGSKLPDHKRYHAIGQAMIASHPGWTAHDHESAASALHEKGDWNRQHFHGEASKILRQTPTKSQKKVMRDEATGRSGTNKYMVNALYGRREMKSLENDMSKGGEGSRGGKIIGRTKSGKPIYSAGHHIYTQHGSIASNTGTAGRMMHQYTTQDHYDASDFHHAKGQEAMENFKKKNATDKPAAEKHLHDFHLHSKASGAHVSGAEWATRREENKAAVADQDKRLSPHERHYRDLDAKDRAAGEHKQKIQRKVERHRTRMAKSIACPACEADIPRAYAMKSLAALAKGMGGKVPENMAALVKGAGIKHITCPECVATVSPQYAVKSLGVLARSEGYDIEPALRAMFGKSLEPPQGVLPMAQPVPRVGNQFDQQLAAHIEKHGFLSAAGHSAAVAAPHQPHAMFRMGPNDVLTGDGRIVNANN